MGRETKHKHGDETMSNVTRTHSRAFVVTRDELVSRFEGLKAKAQGLEIVGETERARQVARDAIRAYETALHFIASGS